MFRIDFAKLKIQKTNKLQFFDLFNRQTGCLGNRMDVHA